MKSVKIKISYLVFFVLLIGCASTPSHSLARQAVDATRKGSKRLILSDKVKAAVRKVFPQFRPYAYRHFISKMQESYNGLASTKETPMAVEGDFDGNGTEDIVFFLWGKKESNSKNQTYLVFVSSYQSANPEAFEIDEITEMSFKRNQANLSLSLEYDKLQFYVDGVQDGVISQGFQLNPWGSPNTDLYVIRGNQLKKATVSN